MIRVLAVGVTLAALSVTPTAVVSAADDPAADPRADAPFPARIALPDGFFPEGITRIRRVAFVGSLVDGAIQQQNLRTGRSRQFAPSPGAGKIAVGMDVDWRGRLWVAGGGPGLDPAVAPSIRVYDTRTGALLLDRRVDAGFLNDVVVTRRAAWFTDSFSPRLIRVPIARDGSIGAPEPVRLAGDWTQVDGFNANGIVATPRGGRLIVAQSTAPDGPGAALYVVRALRGPDRLRADRIRLSDTLAGADGLVLVGRTLYSVAGPPGVVKLRLNRALTRAGVLRTLPVPGAVTPTTAAVFAHRLYVVDAKFPLFGDPTVPFQTTAIRR